MLEFHQSLIFHGFFTLLFFLAYAAATIISTLFFAAIFRRFDSDIFHATMPAASMPCDAAGTAVSKRGALRARYVERLACGAAQRGMQPHVVATTPTTVTSELPQRAARPRRRHIFLEA